MSTSDIGFAIVGTGMVAQYHAQAIAQTHGSRLVAVSRADPARATEAAARFEVPCETSFEALLARDDVDAVCICTPSGLHAAQVIAAAQAGKHVLVEKPMALTLADADASIAACHAARVVLGVALQRRTGPVLQRVHEAIAAGELGRLTLGTASAPYWRPQSYYDSAAWRGTWALDGGALMNQGIHLVDLLLWYMGDVADVQARVGTLAHTIEVEDCITAALRFTSGALGSIVATTAATPGFPHRVEVYGDRGGVQIEGEQIVRWPGEDKHPNEQRVPTDAGAGASRARMHGEGHIRLVSDLVAAIREGRAPLVPGEEGRRSLALVLAVYESARTGQIVKPG
jgi:UDP-N-acetyl-2-amino-2-deoxyglucuronate dehydrogenase